MLWEETVASLISLYVIFSMNALRSLFCAPKFHDYVSWCTVLFIYPSLLYAVPNIPLDSGHTCSSGKFPSTSSSVSFLYSLFLFSQIFFSDNCKERETYFRNSLYCLSGLFSGLSSGTRSLQHGLISLLLENKVLLLPKVKVSNFSRDYIASRS